MPRPRTVSDEAILDAALALAHRIGPARVTFAAVGAEVGLSAATLVQRFGSKRGLLLATDKRGVDLWVSALDRSTAASPLERVVEGLVSAVDGVATPERMANSVALLQLDLADPDFHAETLRGARAVRARLERDLREALDAGELRAGTDPVSLATLVETTYHGAMIGWAIHRELPLAERMRAQVEAVLAPHRRREATVCSVLGEPVAEPVTDHETRRHLMDRYEIDEELSAPGAQELLTTTASAHLAYTGTDGTPRVIPVGFYWTGSQVVVATATTSPKVAALRADPDVAVSIDSGATPGGARAVSIRGRADIEIVDGVVEEYLAMSRISMDPGAAAEFEQAVRGMYPEMARIAITPTWARFYDYGAGRMPRFLQELAERARLSPAAVAAQHRPAQAG